MPKDWPETHIQRIRGTADLPASETSAAIAVESASNNLVFRALGGTRKAIDNFSDQTAAGAKTFTGTVAISGAANLSGTTTLSGPTIFTGGQRGAVSVTLADTIAPAIADSGTVYICTKTSSTQIVTLPQASTAGLQYTFVCGQGAAAGEIQIGVTTGDLIVSKTSAAQDATGLLTTATTGLLKNTAAGNVVGDWITLVSDGLTSWYTIAQGGAWTAT